MKHYIILKPEYQNTGSVALYAPYDAHISGIRAAPEHGLEGEIWLDGGNEWQFSVEHLLILDSLEVGSFVRAGELLGYVPAREFDVVYAVGAEEPVEIDGWMSPFAALDSIFNNMSDDVLLDFQRFGVTDRQQLIYSKDYRDEYPCKYRDTQGGLNDLDHPEDWVILE